MVCFITDFSLNRNTEAMIKSQFSSQAKKKKRISDHYHFTIMYIFVLQYVVAVVAMDV